MESVLKTLIQKKLVNSGFLYGPICPIYGFGAIIMFLFLNSFKGQIILLFLISFFILSTWEYIVGWLLEKIFNTKYWDYTQNKFNIKGRVCLLNSLFWGILGVIFIEYIHPFINSKIELIPKEHLFFITTILSIIIVIDVIITTIKVKNITLKLENLKELTNTIKEKLEQIENKQITLDNIQEKIDDLKIRQAKIKRKLIKQTNRLKKAFPTMKSDIMEKLNELINQKIENIRKDKEK